MTRILVVDNYDSFVYTIVGYLDQLGAETVVVRNDAVLETRMSAVIDGALQFQQSKLQWSQVSLTSADVFIMSRFRQVDQIRLDQFLERFHVAKRIQLSQLVERYVSPLALVKNKAWVVSHASLKLRQEADKVILNNQNQLASLETRLETSNFVNILKRGFAILQNQHQNLIESSASLQSSTHISIRLRDGVVRGVFTPENT